MATIPIRQIPNSIETFPITADSSGDITVVTPSSTQRVVMWGFIGTVASGNAIDIKSNTTILMSLASSTIPLGPPSGARGTSSVFAYCQTAIGEALKITQSSASAINGVVYYSLE